MRPPRRTRSREMSEPLRAVPEYADAPEYDEERAAAAVREFLIAVGEDPNRPGLQEPPARVARAYREVFSGIRRDPAAVLEKFFQIGHEELVLVKDIEIQST